MTNGNGGLALKRQFSSSVHHENNHMESRRAQKLLSNQSKRFLVFCMGGGGESFCPPDV